MIACVVDEEHASIGADALVTRWRADGAVVTEPTDLQVAIAHKGFEWVEIETEGRAAHGSRPRDGRDAIRLMGARADRSRRARPRTCSRGRRTPLLGTASLHASLIEGGRELSSYPDRCHLQMERRTIPGEAPGVAAREVDALLARLRADDPDFKAASKEDVRALAVRDRGARIQLLARACTAAREQPRGTPAPRTHRDELLDRCGDPGRRGHPVDPLRPDRRRAARRRGVGGRAVGAARAATPWSRWRATGAARRHG